MDAAYRPIGELLRRVRARWWRLTVFQGTLRAALAASGVLALAFVATAWTGRSFLALGTVSVAAIVLAVAALVWGFWPARKAPTDARIARFIEEREPWLDDRLVSAVHLSAEQTHSLTSLVGLMVADAGRRASAVDPRVIVPNASLRRAGYRAVGAALVLGTVAFSGRETGRRAIDALSLALFPSRVALEVTPGDARLRVGSPLRIEARLVGNRAPVVAQVLRAETMAGAGGSAEDEAWRATEMATDGSGRFTLSVEAVGVSFKYRVVAGAVTSPTYEIRIVQAPRVARIDLEYTYPPALRLPRRTEEDSGDIYAPVGTDVRLRVHTVGAATTGRITLADGKTIVLTPQASNVLAGALTVVEDSSYRVALADREGFANPGYAEYFIRTLEDRLPEVRVLKPARDREVTPLEEVDIEAQAEDDFGIERLELVYAVGGGAERVVPLSVATPAVSVTGAHTLYLEDLNVQPGDFVSYYGRARDVARGRRAREARSDIFFLEVKPFEQEFALAENEATGRGDRSVADLAAAQKEIIVATWKLDRRAQASGGARSDQDVKAVARAEAELKARVEATASSFRESTMRDPRRPPLRPDSPLRAGQTLPGEDAMTAAAMAMGQAVASLDRLKTAEALTSEMEALDNLLKAHAEAKRRQEVGQQAGNSGGENRGTQDLSSLFDQELLREQRTNYEMPLGIGKRETAQERMLDKLKELARRQDELLRQQQELARCGGMTPEERRRELQELTREQFELRQRAEEMAGEMASQPGRGRGGGDNSRKMGEAAEAMRSATSDLRRQDSDQASASGNRAIQKLDELRRQLQATAPDERRRALGDMQLEAWELADAQRQVASERGKVGSGESGREALRRLASDEERLAERVHRLQDSLERQAAGVKSDRSADAQPAGDALGDAAREAAREIDRQRIADRMQQSADQMRAAAGGVESGKPPSQPASTAATLAAQQEIARALEKTADTLASATGGNDKEARRLIDQLARAQELRQRIDSLARELENLAQPSGQSDDSPAQQKSASESSQSGQGRSGGGVGSGDVGQLREEYSRQLQQAREILDQLRRENPAFAQGDAGFTFEDRSMTLSAPGTESFKQDFAKWEQLRKQATLALEQAESEIARHLQAGDARVRLAAGVDDKPPAGYQQQVDSYFKALAWKKKP